MPQKRRHQENTELPAKLAHKIAEGSTGAAASGTDNGRFKKRFKNPVKSRKQARKQAREDKKQRKNEDYRRKHGFAVDTLSSKISKNKNGQKKQSQPSKPASAKNSRFKENKAGSIGRIDERAKLIKFAKRNQGMYQLLRDSNLIENVDNEAGVTSNGKSIEDIEERELRRLERNLDIKASSKLESAFYEEGLGDLLEGLSYGSKDLRGTNLEPARANLSIKQSTKSSDNPELDEKESEEDEDDASEDDAFGLNDFGMGDHSSGSESEDSDIAEMYKQQGIDINLDLSENENQADDYFNSVESDSEVESDEGHSDAGSYQEETPADKGSVVATTAKSVEAKVGRYIPPSLRQNETESEDEQVAAIRKVLQGQLNRLSETNIEAIVLQVESLYIKYPRHHVTDVLASLLLQSIQSRIHMLDTFLYVNAALVGAVYRIVGLDPVAHLVQKLMEEFEKHFNQGLSDFKATAANDDMDDGDEMMTGKQCQNLCVFIAELYNFQVISCQLVYDVVRLCIQDVNEFTAELLLRLIRISGIQLRKDDPLALKSIVQKVNEMVNAKGAKSFSVRCQFMFENLMNLKDNRMRNAMSQNADNVAKLKRLLGNMDKRRTVGAVEPINIGLDDIREVETKGKWWLVGASWVGNQYTGDDSNNSRMSEAAQAATMHGLQSRNNSESNSEMERLLKLAREQHMNTDVRRSIFITLLSSDDYTDAFERLLKLDLKKTQAREVVRVLLHCCGQEKAYNPYYTLVAFKLCSYHNSYRHTLQYALWDFLRELGESDVGGLGRIGQESDSVSANVPLRRIVNTAKLYGWLIDKQVLSLLILKTVTFAKVGYQARTFFQIMFSTLFLQHKKQTEKDTEELFATFQRAVSNPTMCQGMLMFFHHFVKNCELVGDEEQSVLKWGCKLAKKVLRNVELSSGPSSFAMFD